jgi:DNA polymerase-3 subunit alpha
VLITPTDFTDWVPVRSQELEDEDVKGRIVVSQWEDVYCERRGLLKLDILGVKQLDVFHKCFDLIKKRHDIELTFEDIDTHDKEVFKKFHQGDNFGVFQFNSQLQSNYMRGMLPNSVEDLCASNALLRPGPMNVGAHELFVKLKKGQEKPEYDHACVKPYVSNTQSLMIYQEQIMQVANVLGGLSLAEADMMRSSIKKKDEKSLSQFKEKFISGCRSKGLDEKHSMRVWEKILSFSAYGFNKSHSMTYALQGYYCQWLKTYFPTEFYAATLQFASDDAKKHENIYTHRQNAITEGIEIITPDINGSISTFEITKDDKIWWPIVALKGVGDKAVKSLEECRPFVSFDDFLQKINGRLVNKRVVEKLVFSGAMDKFGDRKDLLIKYAMFKKSKEGEKYNALTEIDFRKLQDETLGYISISYKQQYAASFSKHVMKCKDVSVAPLDARVCIGGLVTKLRQHKARNGMMAFMTVEDAGEVYDIVVFASVYKSYQDKDLLNKVVEIRGTKGKSFKGEQQIVLGMPNSDKIFALN